jgi:hypothetical protein
MAMPVHCAFQRAELPSIIVSMLVKGEKHDILGEIGFEYGAVMHYGKWLC